MYAYMYAGVATPTNEAEYKAALVAMLKKSAGPVPISNIGAAVRNLRRPLNCCYFILRRMQGRYTCAAVGILAGIAQACTVDGHVRAD